MSGTKTVLACIVKTFTVKSNFDAVIVNRILKHGIDGNFPWC